MIEVLNVNVENNIKALHTRKLARLFLKGALL